MTVIVDGGGGGMEPMAPIVVVDGGIGSLHQQRLSLTEAAVGWIQRGPCPAVMVPTQRSLASRSSLTMGVIDGGDGGMEPMASIIVVDDGDGDHCQLQWRPIAAVAMMTIVNDGSH